MAELSLREMVSEQAANLRRSMLESSARSSSTFASGMLATRMAPVLGAGGFGTPMSSYGGFFNQDHSLANMAYYGGFGQSLRAATGGLFFRNSVYAEGAPMGAASEFSRDEMLLRARALPGTLASALTFGAADVGGALDNPLQASRQRTIAQLLASQQFSTAEGGTRTGYGLRSSSDRVRAMGRVSRGAMQDIQRETGFALDEDQLEAVQTGALSVIGSTRLGGMSGNPKEFGRVFKDTAKSIKAISENLQVGFEAASEIMKSLTFALDPQKNRDLFTMFANGRVSGLSGPAYASVMRQQLTAARAMGAFNPNQAFAIASQGVTQTQGLFTAAQSGSMSMTSMSAWGGNGEEEQRINAMMAMRRYGMNFGFSSSGLASLYQTNPKGLQSALGGSLFDVYGAGAASLIASPMSALTARYNPAAINRMSRGGLSDAYRLSGMEASMLEGMGIGSAEDIRAFQVSRLQRHGGIGSEAQALATFDLYSGLERSLGDKLGPKFNATNYLGLANSAINAGVGDMGRVAGLIERLDGKGVDARNLSEIGLMAALGDDDPRVATLIKRLKGLKRGGVAQFSNDDGVWSPLSTTSMNPEFAGIAREALEIGVSPTEVARLLAQSPTSSPLSERHKGGVIQRTIRGAYEAVGGFSDRQWSDARPDALIKLIESKRKNVAGRGRQALLADAGDAAEVLLAGTSGGGIAARTAQLRASALSNPGSLSQAQRAFGSGLTGEGVSLDAIVRMGPDAMREWVTMMSGETGDAAAVRAASITGEKSFRDAMSRIKMPSAAEATQSYVALYANYNRSALSATYSQMRGTENMPLWVKVKGKSE